MDTMNEHPTSYDLDCLSARAVSAERAHVLQGHVAHCPSCAAYLQRLADEHAALLARKPAALFVNAVIAAAHQPEAAPHRPWWAVLQRLVARPMVLRWSVAAAGALVLAVCASLLLTHHRPTELLRTMGTTGVTVYLRHAGAVTVPSAAQTRIHPGDAVRFVIRSSQPRYAALVFVDDRGASSWVLPSAGGDPAVMLPVGETAVPGSVMFDSQPGGERALLVLRDEPFVAEQALQRFLRAWEAAGRPLQARWQGAPADGSTWSMVFVRP